MKLVFKIKTELVTQAGIIVAIFAFSSSLLLWLRPTPRALWSENSEQLFLLALFI
jgi:hypothetical protein